MLYCEFTHNCRIIKQIFIKKTKINPNIHITILHPWVTKRRSQCQEVPIWKTRCCCWRAGRDRARPPSGKISRGTVPPGKTTWSCPTSPWSTEDWELSSHLQSGRGPLQRIRRGWGKLLPETSSRGPIWREREKEMINNDDKYVCKKYPRVTVREIDHE